MKNNRKNNRTIYLLSSNATREYILDALEVLALPCGAVQHFRYQLKWVSEELKENIKKDINLKYTVIVCYLYQEENNGQWKWIDLYPLREGVLVDVYKTGDSDEDVVHFYFGVRSYFDYNKCRNNLIDSIKKQGSWNKYYASFVENLSQRVDASKNDYSYSHFVEICEKLSKKHFKSPDGKTAYYPIFCSINGLKIMKSKWKFWKKEEEILSLKYDDLSHKSYYEISEGSYCSLGLRTYFPQNPPEFSIILKTDEKLFSSPSEQNVRISSRYSEENFVLVPKIVERDSYTLLSLQTDCKKSGNKEPLNLNISFLIKIKRNIWFRIFEVTGDLGFGIGTASIALAKTLEKWDWWYWPVIGCYLIWMICKLVIKLLWRG